MFEVVVKHVKYTNILHVNASKLESIFAQEIEMALKYFKKIVYLCE